MKLCPYCGEPATGIKVADDDFLDYCPEHGIIEGQTIETKEPDPLMQFAWSTEGKI